jgi:hypothetical protein
MTQFRLTQISDTHLGRRLPKLIQNFNRIAEHIDATRPDLVINSGDIGFDGPSMPEDLEFARSLHDSLPVTCRYLPGNHDIGDNPTQIGPVPTQLVSEKGRQAFIAVFGDDRWRFDAASWCFIGLNSLVMNSGLVTETEQFDWLAGELANTGGKPVALFLHKPIFLNSPDAPELGRARSVMCRCRRDGGWSRRYATSICGWSQAAMCTSAATSPSAVHGMSGRRLRGFIISDAKQERIGLKEVGLVEYRFQPDSFEVRHIRAAGQVDVDLDEIRSKEPKDQKVE